MPSVLLPLLLRLLRLLRLLLRLLEAITQVDILQGRMTAVPQRAAPFLMRSLC
jgi:hypothetical protein